MNYAKTFIGYEKDFERKGDLKKKRKFFKARHNCLSFEARSPIRNVDDCSEAEMMQQFVDCDAACLVSRCSIPTISALKHCSSLYKL